VVAPVLKNIVQDIHISFICIFFMSRVLNQQSSEKVSIGELTMPLLHNIRESILSFQIVLKWSENFPFVTLLQRELFQEIFEEKNM
jgi:hypothetical protein